MNEATNPPPLKVDPKYGYYPHWPQDGDDWLHPEDVQRARTLFPSHKIWKRDGQQGEFHVIRYGRLQLRVRPALWQEVAKPAYQIGDWVEVRTRLMKNDAHTGRVVDVEWDEYRGEIIYRIEEREKRIVNAYTVDDLTPVESPTNYYHSTLPADTPEATDGVDDLVKGLPKDENYGPPRRR